MSRTEIWLTPFQRHSPKPTQESNSRKYSKRNKRKCPVNKSLVKRQEIMVDPVVSFHNGQNKQNSDTGTCAGTSAFQCVCGGDVHRCYTEQIRYRPTVKICRTPLLGVTGRWNRRLNLMYISIVYISETKGEHVSKFTQSLTSELVILTHR